MVFLVSSLLIQLRPGEKIFSPGGNPVQQDSISKEATEKVWLGSLRCAVQQWTDLNCSMTDAGKISG